MNAFLKRAEELFPDLKADRRYVHENAEVGLELPKTVAYVKKKLVEYGYRPEEIHDCAGGVTCTVGHGGKTILLRADMDALPQTEISGEPFSCKTGVCHSCGHDTHTAMLLTAARMLKERENELAGTVKFMFQPGEEGWLGAEKMVKAGILENPKVDAGIACHSSSLPAGTIRYSYGGCRSALTFSIKIHGQVSHGAEPHKGISTLTAAANIILAAQQIPSMEVDNAEAAVISICQVRSGEANNITPALTTLDGTIRVYKNEIGDYCEKRFREICENIAKAYRCTVEFDSFGIPVLPNDRALAEELGNYIREVAGEHAILNEGNDVATEDFAFVAKEVPGVLLNIGMSWDDYPLKQGHNPAAVRNEEGLKYGAACYANCAYSWLKKHSA